GHVFSARQCLLRVSQYSGPTHRHSENAVLSDHRQSRARQGEPAIGGASGRSIKGSAEPLRSGNSSALQRTASGGGVLQPTSATDYRPEQFANIEVATGQDARSVLP